MPLIYLLAQNQFPGGMFALFPCGFGLFGLLLFVFWIWMLIDCLQRDFGDGSEKLIWVLVLVFLNFVGALIYYFIGRGKGVKA